MKSTLSFLFLISFFSLTLFAQNIPNASFENWQNVAPYNVSEPVGWFTSNILGFTLGLSPNATKVTDSHSGSYAIRLETVAVPGGDVLVGSAICMTGIQNKPEKVTGYYKASLQGSDGGGAGILIRGNGTAIGVGGFDVLEDAGSYTYFEMPIEYFTPGIEPDTFQLMLFASTDYLTAGSVVFFDDLTFDGVSAIRPAGISNPAIKLWPNPASERVQLRIPEGMGEVSLQFFSPDGKLMGKSLFSGQTELDISGWTPGRYFYEVRNAQGQLLHSNQLIVAR